MLFWKKSNTDAFQKKDINGAISSWIQSKLSNRINFIDKNNKLSFIIT